MYNSAFENNQLNLSQLKSLVLSNQLNNNYLGKILYVDNLMSGFYFGSKGPINFVGLNNSQYNNNDMYFLSKFGINPNLKGLGIGKLLFEDLQLNFEKLFLRINKNNNSMFKLVKKISNNNFKKLEEDKLNPELDFYEVKLK